MRRDLAMVFAGSFWPAGTERGLADGFRALGWAVQEVDGRDFTVGGGGGYAARIAARLLRSAAAGSFQQAILEACRSLRPDVFLTTKGVHVTSELLREIKDFGTRVVMYYPDRDFYHQGISESSFNEYDLFVTTKTFQLKYLSDKLTPSRVAYVPHGYVGASHRGIFRDIPENKFLFDSLYIGNYSLYKERWIRETLDKIPTSIDVIGDRWPILAEGALPRCQFHGRQTGILYAQAIQSARINIAIHFGPGPKGWSDLVSTRTFEIPACRGFMLHIDNEEVREFFKPGEEIDVFATPEELADKIQFYLPRSDLRARMIERAYNRAVPGYSYEARASELHRLIVERLLVGRAHY